MHILENLEPGRVFYYFEELSGIPHGSRNTKAISDYCVAFAKARGLRVIQDASNNVVIFHPGTSGYEDHAPVIIQGHLDMVCEKEPDSTIDFLQDGLTLVVEGDYVHADRTTLGGDDGIAVAFALAILHDDTIPHPPLEVVLTVDEEIGMLGANALDYSVLQGRTMLNLDSEDEGSLLVSCAGGVTATCHIPVVREAAHPDAANSTFYTLTISGLTGGHSGVEIIKGRANASKLLGRVLYALSKETSLWLVSLCGGLKDNAIPREASACLTLDDNKYDIHSFITKWQHILQKEYAITDPSLTLILTQSDRADAAVMDPLSTQHAIHALYLLPNGIQSMSHDIEGLVQTSQNLGILDTTDTEVTYSFSTRSSVASEKAELLSRMECLMQALGGTLTTSGDYPAWEYRKDSPLRDLMAELFTKQYGYAPKIEAIHAGVECGLFAEGLPGLDCVSFGPLIEDIHTPKERLSISSVQRTWEYTLAILNHL